MYLENISGDFPVNNLKKKTRLNGFEYNFYVDLQLLILLMLPAFINNFMKKHDIKECFCNY